MTVDLTTLGDDLLLDLDERAQASAERCADACAEFPLDVRLVWVRREAEALAYVVAAEVARRLFDEAEAFVNDGAT